MTNDSKYNLVVTDLCIIIVLFKSICIVRGHSIRMYNF